MQNEISKMKSPFLSPPLTLQAELLDYQQNENMSHHLQLILIMLFSFGATANGYAQNKKQTLHLTLTKWVGK